MQVFFYSISSYHHHLLHESPKACPVDLVKVLGTRRSFDTPPISCKSAALSYLLDEASESGPVNLVEVLLGDAKRHPTATIEHE